MILCEVVLKYMHIIGINDYMMKVLASLDEVTFTLYVDVWNIKVCGPMKSLLSMCGVMELYMSIALVD